MADRDVSTGAVTPDVVHRVIEAQVARDGDRPAIVDDTATVSYRALNSRANTLARSLMCAGLRRGGHAMVAGEAGTELAVALLAVLKAGASYTWTPTSRRSVGPVVTICHQSEELPDEYLVSGVPADVGPVHPSPNLPVLVRGSDAACIVDSNGASATVSHAAIAGRAARSANVGDATGPVEMPQWAEDPAATSLWNALMTGATLATGTRAAAA